MTGSAPRGGDAGSALRRLGAGLAALAAAASVACGPAGASPGGSGTTELRLTRVTGSDAVARSRSSPSASWADVDGDGDEDLYVLNGYPSLETDPAPQRNEFFRNDGGVLEAMPDHPLVRDAAYAGSAVWGDYDDDGDPDLFVANQRGADNSLYRNDGGGAFVRVTGTPPVEDGGRSFSAAWVDVDGDGWLDLHVLNGRDGEGGEVDFLYRNEEGDGFARVEAVPFADEALASGGAAWGDWDRDGDPDLFLPVYSGEPGRLYRNDGDWTFTEIAGSAGVTPDPLPYSPAASVAHWVDWDGDADLDLFVGTTRGTVDYLYENRGGGRLRRVVAGRVGMDATYVSDALWTDLENDADLDLVLAVWGGASEIYRNDGSGRLRPARAGDFGAEVTFASSVSASDVDGDGDQDLFLTQWPLNDAGGAPNLLYRNVSDAGNWIEVALEGTASNRSAIGAQILVTAEVDGAARRQLRHVTSRTSWRSAGGPSRHFGLGDADEADRIVVRWPSGRADTVEGPVPANRRLTIREGG